MTTGEHLVAGSAVQISQVIVPIESGDADLTARLAGGQD
jgi:hypothetical protein